MRKAADNPTTPAARRPATPRRRAAKLSGYAVGLALAALARPAAADPVQVGGFLFGGVAPGAGGAEFIVCNYPAPMYPLPPCGKNGSTVLTTIFLDFRPFQTVIDIPGRTASTADIAFYAACAGQPGGCNPVPDTVFTLSDAPPAPPPGTPQLTADQKRNYAHWSNYVGIAASGMAYAAAGFTGLGNAPGAVATAGMSAMTAAFSFVLNDIALDPIDGNYTTIAEYNPPYPPVADLSAKPCMVSGGSTGGGPAQWFANNIGLAQAISTSYNRMQGAIAAGDSYWTAQQGQAMEYFAAVLDSRLASHPLSTVFNCITPLPLTSAAAVLAWERSVATNGMSPALANLFAALGLTDSRYTGFLYIQDPELVADAFNAILGQQVSRPVYWQILDNNVP
jgi:hypothetical protein